MDYKTNENHQVIIDHYTHNWGKDYEIKRWRGKMNELHSEFCILEFPPTLKRKMWTYATCGMTLSGHGEPIELHVFSKERDAGLVELLTAISFYHLTEGSLNLNHTVNFGRPWQGNSLCSYGLVSLSYLDGPKLEILERKDSGKMHFYWLLPITTDELNFIKEKGVDTIEEKFDNTVFDYLNPHRESVV